MGETLTAITTAAAAHKAIELIVTDLYTELKVRLRRKSTGDTSYKDRNSFEKALGPCER